MNFIPNILKKIEADSLTKVMVFRTNLNSKKDIDRVAPLLDTTHIVLLWSVDTNDIDKVLRIEGFSDKPEEINAIIKRAGYQCEELND